jgi:hypothetical protein
MTTNHSEWLAEYLLLSRSEIPPAVAIAGWDGRIELSNSDDGWEAHITEMYAAAEREGRLCEKCRGVLGGPIHVEKCG